MKIENTFQEWLDLVEQSSFNFKGIIQEENREVDLTELIPSLSKLKEKNIKIINVPYFIRTNGDELKRKQIEIDELENELNNLTHIYSITITRSINSDWLTLKNALIVRGVFKE